MFDATIILSYNKAVARLLRRSSLDTIERLVKNTCCRVWWGQFKQYTYDVWKDLENTCIRWHREWSSIAEDISLVLMLRET